ncbi:metallophosphoesterase family protein [Aureimonas populi]|uniref:Metallophosphoesterase family protein n=1 Tax=Aureimonas populi TaxID=1701758 RepID=A0ABW5CR02_9HYPH|nr:metallophosphoesterase family protein [Aureimonas populi]
MSKRPGRHRRRYKLSAEPDVIYAIGDVHGHLDKLIALEQLIVEDGRDLGRVKLILMLGDYIDRGPDSAGTITHLMGRPPEGFHRLCLLGNHDDMFLEVLEGRVAPEALLPYGGLATFASYGCDLEEYESGLRLNGRRLAEELARTVPGSHEGFIRGLPVLVETPRHVFVHAGLRPGVPIEEQEDRDLLWIREPFLSHSAPAPKIVVHGHTPADAPTRTATRIGVDTGAGFEGPLAAVRITRAGEAFLQVGE